MIRFAGELIHIPDKWEAEPEPDPPLLRCGCRYEQTPFDPEHPDIVGMITFCEEHAK